MPGPFGNDALMAQILGMQQLSPTPGMGTPPAQPSMMTTPPPNQIMAQQAQQMGQAPVTSPNINPTGLGQ